MTSHVNLVANGALLEIRIDDGKVNALNSVLIDDLIAALRHSSATAKAIIICGRSGVLSAGYDLRVIQGQNASDRALLRAKGQALIEAIYASPKPVVIACTGHAMAAGALLLLAADYRIGASGQFRIGLNETSIGLKLPDFVLALARDRLDPHHVFGATVGARVFTAEEAIAAGYLDRTVAANEVVDAARAAAMELAQIPQTSYWETKSALRGGVLQRMRTAQNGIPSMHGWDAAMSEAFSLDQSVTAEQPAKSTRHTMGRAEGNGSVSLEPETVPLAAPRSPNAATVVGSSNGRGSILKSVALHHGPADVLGRYVLAAERRLRQMGIGLRASTPEEILRVNELNRDTWRPLLSVFDPRFRDQNDAIICAVGEDDTGRIIGSLAARFMDWEETNFAREAESLRLFYSDPERQKLPQETCRVTAMAAHGIRGRVAFSGAAWYHPSVRGRGLFAILPRVARTLAHATWGTDCTVTISDRNLVNRGVTDQAGFANCEFAVDLRQARIGDFSAGLLWSKTEEMLEDVKAYTVKLEQAIHGEDEMTTSARAAAAL